MRCSLHHRPVHNTSAAATRPSGRRGAASQRRRPDSTPGSRRAGIGLLARSLGAAKQKRSSRNAITRCSYSAGAASMPPVCSAPGTFQICFGSPAAAKYFGCLDVLAAHAGLGVDEEHRAGRDLADAVDDRRRRAMVREHGCGGRITTRSGANRRASTPVSVGVSRAGSRRPRRRPPGTRRTSRRPRAGSRRRPKSRGRRCDRDRRRAGPGGTRAPAIRSRSPAQRTRSPSLLPCPRGSRSSTPYPCPDEHPRLLQRRARPGRRRSRRRFFDGT